MPPARPSKKLFPVFVDSPSTTNSLPPSLLEACAGLSLSSSRPQLLSTKENVVVPSGERLALRDKKKASFKSLGACSEVGQPRKRRIALRDVSQEYDVDGEEPEGFREVPILKPEPPSQKLKIFMDEPASLPPASKSKSQPPPSSSSSHDSSKPSSRKTFTVYASPPHPTTLLPPVTTSSTAASKRGRSGGLGGGGKGLRG
ncbi:hypothetical protein BDY24DRAFT_228342 [Mrakia frigida]|uniref:uncharacterized protein n=1 Tax=Mrakia frigida TaxID=29902 RepID=UPI003FCC0D63